MGVVTGNDFLPITLKKDVIGRKSFKKISGLNDAKEVAGCLQISGNRPIQDQDGLDGAAWILSAEDVGLALHFGDD